MTAYVVRPAHDQDAEQMVSIATGNPSAPQWNAAQFRKMLKTFVGSPLCRIVLVVEVEGEVAGFAVASALCAVFPIEAELESLAVAPACQGRGMGTALLRATVVWAAEQRAETFRLEVRASNERAIRIYDKAGFRKTGRRPGYYSAPLEDAVVMERILQSSLPGSPKQPLV